MFDANNFMNAVYTEVNDTRSQPVPAGEYGAVIEKVEPRSGQIKNGERAGQDWAGLSIVYSITDPAVLALLNRTTATVTDLLMLDLTDSGGLDMGKGRNLKLGRLREATNLNTPGQPFSPGMFIGKSVRVMIKHVPGYKDPSQLVAEVSGVTSI